MGSNEMKKACSFYFFWALKMKENKNKLVNAMDTLFPPWNYSPCSPLTTGLCLDLNVIRWCKWISLYGFAHMLCILRKFTREIILSLLFYLYSSASVGFLKCLQHQTTVWVSECACCNYITQHHQSARRYQSRTSKTERKWSAFSLSPGTAAIGHDKCYWGV